MNNESKVEMILVQTGTENELRNYLENRSELLALTYPAPGTKDCTAYSEFFESPFRMERRRCSFRGCLAVNISSYVNAVDSPSLEELASYIASNPEAEYVLYAVVPDMAAGSRLIHRMGDLTDCRKLCFRSHTTEVEGPTVPSVKRNAAFGY